MVKLPFARVMGLSETLEERMELPDHDAFFCGTRPVGQNCSLFPLRGRARMDALRAKSQ